MHLIKYELLKWDWTLKICVYLTLQHGIHCSSNFYNDHIFSGDFVDSITIIFITFETNGTGFYTLFQYLSFYDSWTCTA